MTQQFIFGSTLDRDDYIIHDLSSLGLDIQTGNSQWFLEEIKGSRRKQEKIIKERICRSKNINPRTITCHHLGYFDINRKNDHRGFWLYELKPEISSKIHIPFRLVSIPMASGCAQYHIIYDGEMEDYVPVD